MSTAQLELVPTTLQELVVERLRVLGGPTGPLSFRAAADRGKGQVSYETLRRIARGTYHGQITAGTVQGISTALQVPADQVWRTIGVETYTGPRQLPPEAELLTDGQWETMQQLMRELARGNR